MAAVLSICIPTYNRLDYVRGVIEALDSLRTRLAVELVISDDASSDGTPAYLDALAARDPAVRVYHQPRRLGGFANTAFVLRAARGRFALYHGDDDRLAEDPLIDLIGWLKAHPKHSAIYAPVDCYDLATGCSLGVGFHSAQVMEFDHAMRAELVAYVLPGLTPEHAVYRSDCLRRVGYDARVYWSLGFLDAALQAGTVRFDTTPYYRAVGSHWPGERRPQLNIEVMTDLTTWETFGAGLEMILARQPGIAAHPERLQALRAQIAASICRRQGAALDYLRGHGRWIEFVDSYRILAARQALPRLFPVAELFDVTLRAIAAVLVEQGALTGRGRVVLVGLDDVGDVLAEALRAAGLPVVIGVPSDDDAASALMVAADAAQAEALVSVGVPAHAVFDVSALFQGFDLSELA
jgi:hypothetical protein